MGRFLEDLEVGFTVTTAGRTITEADVSAFAGLSGDFTELHTNEEFARCTQFGRRIAHGALVFSISIGLTTRTNLLDDTLIAFSRVDSLRFTRPVFIGDTVHVSKRLLATEPKTPDAGMLAFDTRVVNQRGQTVLAFVDRLLVRRRGATADETTTRAVEAVVSAG